MAFDLYPAVNEDYEFPEAVREANALTPEFRSQVVPMTETQRNNLTGDQLWQDRLIFNTTEGRINRYNGSDWAGLSSEPPGVVKAYAGATAPSGHVLCQGQVVVRTGIYAALFAIIGTTYNTGGELSTEFRLPNLKSRIPVGVDAGDPDFNNLGETGGAKTVALTTAQMPSHAHGGGTGGQSADHSHSGSTAGEGGHMHTGESGTVDGAGGTSVLRAWPDANLDEGAANAVKAGTGNHGHAFGTGGASVDHSHGIGAEGSGAAHTNMQPYIAMNYIITL
jgi:microcystin-dependent protein